MTYNRILIEAIAAGPNPMTPFLPILYGMVRERASHREDFIGIELGVNGGNSTIAMVSAVAAADQGHIYSLDIVDCDYAAQLVYRAGCGPQWTFTKGDSVAYASDFQDQTVDFVFLDTSHEYASTVAEIAAWTPKLRTHGRMTFHDTSLKLDGVARPIAEFLAANPDWRYWNIDYECGFGVLDKP